MITREMLEAVGAFCDEIEKFSRIFPEGVVPTPEICAKHASDFDFSSAVILLLSAENKSSYQRIRDPALAEYERIAAVTFGILFCKQER